MTSFIHRPRQAIGLIYILLYLGIFFAYAFIFKDDQAWVIQPKFAAAVFIWFILSLTVKISMLMNWSRELLNLLALVAFLTIGAFYYPQPDTPTSIENFCYYLYMIGGSACDLFDFVYEAMRNRPEETLAESEKKQSPSQSRACGA